MFRAVALAVGISLAVLGVECLVIEKAVMAGSQRVTGSSPASMELLQEQNIPVDQAASSREIVPPEWAPWGLLSGAGDSPGNGSADAMTWISEAVRTIAGTSNPS